MAKNFREVSAALAQKRNVVKSCQEAGSYGVTKFMQVSKELSLSIFISAKTHKDGAPFSAIVSENNS